MDLPQPGQVFEGYRVDRELGKGGFASVFGATNARGDAVALKVLTPDKGGTYSRATRARYQREVSILADLKNAHTVQLLGSGESGDGQLYMAFELLGGRDLSDYLEEVGPIAPEQVIGIVRQALLSLREAHGLGLVHRDIKPHNIRLVSEGGTVPQIKLLDFGIARSTGPDRVSVTRTGELLGTPRYMSPEQLVGKEVGATSDIYGLGLVAFEMLMGRDALAGDNIFEQIERMQSGHLFSMPQLEKANVDLVAIIQRMTARKPEDRFQNASEVLAALDQLDGGLTLPDLSAPLPTALPLPGPRANLRPMVLGLVGLALAIIVLGAVASSLRDPPTSPQAEVEPLPRELMTVPTPAKRASALAEVPAAPPEADMALPEGGTAGCGLEAGFVGRGRLDGTLAYVPEGYRSRQTYPLLIVAGGEDRTPGEFLRISGFEELADREGFVILAADGRDWTEETRPKQTLQHTYEAATELLCIDAERVFVFGYAKGSRASILGQCTPWVTAVGWTSSRVGHDRSKWAESGFLCEDPRSTIILNPTNSRVIRPDGGRGEARCGKSSQLSEDEAEVFWSGHLGLKSSERRRVLATEEGACWAWAGGEKRLQMCRLAGGYLWPGTQPIWIRDIECPGETAMNFPIAETVWEFFMSVPTHTAP